MRLNVTAVTSQAAALADLLRGGSLVVMGAGRILAECRFGQVTQSAGTLKAEFRGESRGYGIPDRFVTPIGDGDPSDLSIDIPEVTVNATLIGTFTHTVPR